MERESFQINLVDNPMNSLMRILNVDSYTRTHRRRFMDTTAHTCKFIEVHNMADSIMCTRIKRFMNIAIHSSEFIEETSKIEQI